MHPETARLAYLSSIENAEVLQEAIDIERQYNASRANHAEMVGITFIDEDSGEERHFSFEYPEEDRIASEARIAKNEERLKHVTDFIQEILEDYPWFVEN